MHWDYSVAICWHSGERRLHHSELGNQTPLGQSCSQTTRELFLASNREDAHRNENHYSQGIPLASLYKVEETTSSAQQDSTSSTTMTLLSVSSFEKILRRFFEPVRYVRLATTVIAWDFVRSSWAWRREEGAMSRTLIAHKNHHFEFGCRKAVEKSYSQTNTDQFPACDLEDALLPKMHPSRDIQLAILYKSTETISSAQHLALYKTAPLLQSSHSFNPAHPTPPPYAPSHPNHGPSGAPEPPQPSRYSFPLS